MKFDCRMISQACCKLKQCRHQILFGQKFMSIFFACIPPLSPQPSIHLYLMFACSPMSLDLDRNLFSLRRFSHIVECSNQIDIYSNDQTMTLVDLNDKTEWSRKLSRYETVIESEKIHWMSRPKPCPRIIYQETTL